MTNTVRRHSQPGSRRCAFTGYRPQKMPFGFDESDPRCVDFKNRLKNTIHALYYCGYKHFISGGALGMDMFAAEAVVELREEYPEIILEMVSPFDAQAAKWSPELQARHDRLFEVADITTATGHEYTKGAMFTRNRYLVSNADLLLAAYDGQPGGTAMTIQNAKANGVRVQVIRPVLPTS